MRPVARRARWLTSGPATARCGRARRAAGAVALVTALAGAGLSCAVPASAAVGRARTAPAAGPTGITAAAAEVMDGTSGRRMWSRAMYQRRPIASITKIMTAMVVIEAGHLSRELRVPRAAVTYARENDAGSAGLRAGDIFNERQLLEALLLPSGADAAYTLAHAWRRGWRAFVARMNATARRLGMTGTHFANFDGLPWPSETSTYSTPHALMIMAAAALRLPVLREIVGQRRHSIARNKLHHGYTWASTNLLLGRYPGAIGIKTGFTLGAGYCLLFAARRHGTMLMGVVLDSSANDPDLRFTAAARLLTWGFRHA
jgi:serine-type D-Ala-D-Ala carboxypeptidase (penicillin-binding protein 5/6)